MTKLTPDAPVPALSLPLVGGGTFTLNGTPPANFTMVIFYRGLHCPVCKSYLETLNGLIDGYREAGFDVVAASMNDADTAGKTKAEWNIGNVPVAYGVTDAQAREWGLYVSKAIKDVEADVFCEPGLFWVRPDGRLYLADVSNMPWARPDLAFLLSKVPFAVEKGYPARGGH
ncbi:redoxin domain-containing protein [Silicimonas sp. MF1-12-2]|jgi:peroxiredoxin|uniref:redoxin domain-containing protein n=1 Tax=Silicimonas sp. MF1-12-2 TaxID=3384793 RepID=UPI0039B39A24